MSSFKDSTGREWTLDVNVGTVAVVYKETGVSFYKILDDKCRPLAELIDDVPLLANVCYLLSEAQSQGVTPTSFAVSLKGDALQGMATAFVEALTDFFPDARRRAALTKLRESWEAIQNKTLDALAMEMEKINPEEVSNQVLATLTAQ